MATMIFFERLNPNLMFGENLFAENISRKSAHGGFFTLSSQGAIFVLNLVRTMILARLLTPDDFGLIGMVMVVVNFAMMFKEAGLSTATIQQKEISHEQISTLFWVNVLLSGVLTIGIAISAPFVAKFYGRSELSWVVVALSLPVFFSGLQIQHKALLQRNMMFFQPAFCNVISQIAGLLTAIILALHGFRYWALVWASCVQALTCTLLIFCFCPWIPGRMNKGAGVRKMLLFGGHVAGFDIVNYFTRNLDNILIGKFFGAASVGLYSKAYQIVYFPITNIRAPVNQVALPAMSRACGETESYRRLYIKIIELLSLLTMPLMFFCFMCAEPLVLFIFGDGWTAMIPLFRLFSLAGIFQAVGGTKGLLLLSEGYSKEYFIQGLVGSAASVIAFCIGIRWGAYGVASAFVISFYLIMILTFSYTFHYSKLSIKDFTSGMWCSGVSCLLAGGVLYTTETLFSGFLNLAFSTLIYGFAFILFFLCLPGGKIRVKDLLGLMRHFRKK